MPGATLPRLEANCFDPSAADEKLLEKMPEWMRADQVASVLGGCSRETVRAYRLRGNLHCRDFRPPGSKIPCWRFYKGGVREFLSKLPTGKFRVGLIPHHHAQSRASACHRTRCTGALSHLGADRRTPSATATRDGCPLRSRGLFASGGHRSATGQNPRADSRPRGRHGQPENHRLWPMTQPPPTHHCSSRCAARLDGGGGGGASRLFGEARQQPDQVAPFGSPQPSLEGDGSRVLPCALGSLAELFAGCRRRLICYACSDHRATRRPR